MMMVMMEIAYPYHMIVFIVSFVLDVFPIFLFVRACVRACISIFTKHQTKMNVGISSFPLFFMHGNVFYKGRRGERFHGALHSFFLQKRSAWRISPFIVIVAAFLFCFFVFKKLVKRVSGPKKRSRCLLGCCCWS